MSEQFGAIPVRAFGDTRLSAADFRLLGAIAYFDRLGRNGTGCYADPRKLAELAAIDYSHVTRHTRRLKEFGYLEISRSETDRRKRVYSLIYNEDRTIVADIGDNPDEATARGVTVTPLDEKVASSGDNPSENVAKPNSQSVDPVAKSHPKRSCKTYLRNSAKPCARGSENRAADSQFARQGDRRGGGSLAQCHFMLPIRGTNQQPKNQPSAPDWLGWAGWLQSHQGMTGEVAWLWIMERLDQIEKERGVGKTEAGGILDRELKRRRKVAA